MNMPQARGRDRRVRHVRPRRDDRRHAGRHGRLPREAQAELPRASDARAIASPTESSVKTSSSSAGARDRRWPSTVWAHPVGFGKPKASTSARSTSRPSRTHSKAAIAARQGRPRVDRSRRDRATRCRPRTTPSTARGTWASRPARPSPRRRADRQPPVRFGHPVDRQRGADDPARRSANDRAGRRHGEHEPSTVRAATVRARASASACSRRCRICSSSLVAGSATADLYMAQTAEKVAKRLNISREEQDAYALRSHQLGRRGGQGRSLRRRDRAGRDLRRASGDTVDRHRRPHQAPTRRWKAWRSCARPSARKAR